MSVPSPPPASQPAQRRALATFVALMRAEGALGRALAPTVESSGLTMTQFAVLEALLHLGPLGQRSVGERILRSESNVTTVLANLERDGLVIRKPDLTDGRVRVVHLTRAGRTLIQRLFPAHSAELAQAMSTLSARELDQLRALCRRLELGVRGADADPKEGTNV